MTHKQELIIHIKLILRDAGMTLKEIADETKGINKFNTVQLEITLKEMREAVANHNK